MIGSLRGVVLERTAEAEVLLEVGGVGYRVVVTPRTLGALEPATPAFLHVHHHIREDAQTLYGFLARDERACFEALLGAHGVGPALALAILATYSPATLRRHRGRRRRRRRSRSCPASASRRRRACWSS